MRARRAPATRLLWFEESGHEAFADEPEKFNRAMVALVRPFAIAGSEGVPAASAQLPAAPLELRVT